MCPFSTLKMNFPLAWTSLKKSTTQTRNNIMMYLHLCAVPTWFGWPGSGLPSRKSHRSSRTPQQRHLPDWQPLQRQTHRLRLGNASGTGRSGHVQPGIQTRYALVWWSGTLIIINDDNEYLLSTNLSHRTRRAVHVQNWLLHVTGSVYYMLQALCTPDNHAPVYSATLFAATEAT